MDSSSLFVLFKVANIINLVLGLFYLCTAIGIISNIIPYNNLNN